MPLVSAVLMGIVAACIYYLISFALSNVVGDYIRNALATIISIVFAAMTYFICLLKFGGYTEEMLMAFPKGESIVKVVKRLHLI